MTETINGLLTVKPANAPEVGQVKTFVWSELTSKSGKQWIKIKHASPEDGGQPYRIIGLKPTGFTDQYGNISFNCEIEAQGQDSKSYAPGIENEEGDRYPDHKPPQERPVNAPESPVQRSNGEKIDDYAAYATRVFAVAWKEAGKWIETAFPQKDAEEMSIRDFYDFKLRVAMHNAIETAKIIRKERF